MATDNSLITGERRPIIGKGSQYKLRVQYETVRWEVWHGLQCVGKNNSGNFLFKNASLGEGFVIKAFYTRREAKGIEMQATLAVKPLPGMPEFTKISWQDTNYNDIKDKIDLLSDIPNGIYLTVRTENIVPGDWLSAKIMEKELSNSDRSAGRTLYAEVDEIGVARFHVSAELLKQFAEKLNGEDWFKDRTHHYYATVSYFGAQIPDENQAVVYEAGNPPPETKPIIQKVEKSEVLHIANVGNQPIPPDNGIKPVVVMIDKTGSKKLNPVELKLNIFFDGTKNNRENVRSKEIERAKLKTEKEKEEFDKKLEKEDSSYSQGYSNVAILQWCDASKLKQREISIYIEGIGTKDGEDDSTFRGQGMDYGKTNIRAKVVKAINQILERVQKVVKEKEEYVAKAEINVFGFSRGAAAARHFVSKYKEIALNALTFRQNVNFNLVGLFDTVSAHGFSLDHSKGNDVAELGLNIGNMEGKAKKVVQLTAGNEYRANFCLTDITSSIKASVGFEYEMPGAHSDIGGGFRNPVKEQIVDYSPYPLITRLIKDGWYTEKNIIEKIPDRYIPSPTDGIPAHIPGIYRAERSIANEYQYIPLEIMAYFAKEYGEMKFTAKTMNKYKRIPGDLADYRDQLFDDAKAKDGTGHFKASLGGLDINYLRNRYLHLTAFREGGQTGILDWVINRGRYPERAVIEG